MWKCFSLAIDPSLGTPSTKTDPELRNYLLVVALVMTRALIETLHLLPTVLPSCISRKY